MNPSDSSTVSTHDAIVHLCDHFESARFGTSVLVHADAFDVLATLPEQSIHAVVTDPPFTAREFREEELAKFRSGECGVWRAGSPSDGYQRSRKPLFGLGTDDLARSTEFFARLGHALGRVLRPGGHAVVASLDKFVPLVATAIGSGGLEFRAQLLRVYGGNRGGMPARGCEHVHRDTCTFPRTRHEPWLVFRRPLPAAMAVRECLEQWGTGALRRPPGGMLHSVVESSRLPRAEQELGEHPCQKPQAWMRHLVRAVLPVGEGTVLDPFAGSGSTLAACEHLGVVGVGVERHRPYFDAAVDAVPRLADLGRPG